MAKLMGVAVRFVLVGSVAVIAGALTGCGDCSEETKTAQKFLDDPANRTCKVDADCSVVGTGCSGIGFCAQAELNRQVAASQTWKNISDDLTNCDNSCAVCDALLIARCTEGLCGGS